MAHIRMSEDEMRSVVYLCRKQGTKEPQGAVAWAVPKELLRLEWTSPQGFSYSGYIDPKLARLMVKRIQQALRG